MPRIKNLPFRVPLLKQERAKAMVTPRLRGSSWLKIRDRIMRRDCGLCQECKRGGKLCLASEVDHKLPLHRGGSDDDANLEAICFDHHAVKTKAEAGGRVGG